MEPRVVKLANSRCLGWRPSHLSQNLWGWSLGIGISPQDGHPLIQVIVYLYLRWLTPSSTAWHSRARTSQQRVLQAWPQEQQWQHQGLYHKYKFICITQDRPNTERWGDGADQATSVQQACRQCWGPLNSANHWVRLKLPSIQALPFLFCHLQQVPQPLTPSVPATPL